MKHYNKLVRDRIPEIIAGCGNRAVYTILQDAEYISALEKKLSEETAEYLQEPSLEEMADIMEVLAAICKARGFDMVQLQHIRQEKARERGGFEKKIFLRDVLEPGDPDF